MRFTAHPERQCAFEKFLQEQGFIHGKSKRNSPWQNAFVERSHRTYNEEFFEVIEFKSSAERKYLLKLWEYEYNFKRPHQSLGMKTPFQVFKEKYSKFLATRNIT